MSKLEIPKRSKRKFLSEDLKFDSFEKLKPYFEELKERKISSLKELDKWFLDWSEMSAVLQEERAWRFIKMSTDTLSEEKRESFNSFVQEIEAKMEEYWNDLRKKLLENEYTKNLSGEGFFIFLRGIRKQFEIFRESNIELNSEIQKEAQMHGNITGKVTVNVDGKELTIPQAVNFLKDPDRNKRKEVSLKITERRLKDRKALDESFNKLLNLRNAVAKNADFKNYRDYKFEAMERFDYTADDCFKFHDSIEKEVVPALNELYEIRRKELKLDKLKPWDLEVDTSNKKPLKPYTGVNELIDKSIKCFDEINPYFGDRLRILKELKYLDLDSRKGKRGGGYNYPLPEIGVPFIFMNSADSHRDLSTMMHEGGHAIHSFLTRDLKLVFFKDTPSEVAELASMSMELISMEHWSEFYNNEDLRRAKKEQLIDIIESLPWIAAVDSFQHWIYENPNHSVEQRTEKWIQIMNRFGSSVIDWSENKESREISWQKQLHIFEIPFYYIEYGMAQLGAIAIWRNYKKNKEKGLTQYIAALKLGYTKTIKEIYETAGIKFDFSREYIKELIDFVKEELKKVE